MKVLVVIPDSEKRNRTIRFLKGHGYEAEGVAHRQQGFHRALSGNFMLCVIDMENDLEGETGTFVRNLIEARPLLRLVLFDSGGSEVAKLKQVYGAVPQVKAVMDEAALPTGLRRILSGAMEEPHFRRTKIVATIGPASCSEEKLEGLFRAGVNVVRMNFSHGDHAWHAEVIERVRRIASNMQLHIACLQDLCGPKIRTGTLKGGAVQLRKGETVTLAADGTEGTSERFPISAPAALFGDLRQGDRVLLDDGNLELLVEKEGASEAACTVVHGGFLKEHKGVNFPGSKLSLPGLTDKDRNDLRFGIKAGVDYVAVSFVRRPEHIHEAKEIIRGEGADIPVIAKIEKPEALAVIESIINASDGIMVARGDLGVELSAMRVPYIQKKLIRLAREQEKPVITATQMLESMTRSPRPTRAEVADVAKAVEDGTDAVMLSGETAAGAYPVQAVETMAQVVSTAESWIREEVNPFLEESRSLGGGQLLPAVGQGLALIADTVDLSVIAVATRTGRTVCAFSKMHPDSPLIALSDDDRTLRRAALYHGVFGAKIEDTGDERDIVVSAERAVRGLNLGGEGQMIAVVWDPDWKGGKEGSLTVRFLRIGG